MEGGQLMGGQVMDISPLMAWISVLMALLAFGTSVWGIFSAPARKNGERLTQVEKDLTAEIAALKSFTSSTEATLIRLRDRVDGLPNADMMHRLELSLARMEGHIDKLDERLKPVAAIAERMQDLLIEQGHK